MIKVSAVAIEHIDTCWEKLIPYLRGAAFYTYGRYTVEDMYKEVKAGTTVLWIAFDEDKFYGAVITNIVVYPQCTFLNMAFCGGKTIRLWKDDMLEILKQYANANHCIGIESSGRPGWAKIFKNNGYKANWVTYELPI